VSGLFNTWDKDAASRGLSLFVRPDNKLWQFDYDELTVNSIFYPQNIGEHTQYPIPGESCADFAKNMPYVTMIHPEGTKGEFLVGEHCHGQTEVPKLRRFSFNQYSEAFDTYFISRASNLYSISNKKLTFPNGKQYIWSYHYSTTLPAFKGETLTDRHRVRLNVTGIERAHLKTTSVYAPDGSIVVSYFDRRYAKSGNLLYEETYDNDEKLRQRVNFEYKDGVFHGKTMQTGYVNGVSKDPFTKSDLEMSSPYRQLQTSKIIQNFSVTGNLQDTYTEQRSDFNDYDEPRQIMQSNSFSNDKLFIKLGFNQDTNNWLLNLPTTTKLSENGIDWYSLEEYSYYSPGHKFKSLPYQRKAFNRVTTTNTDYYTDANSKASGRLKKVVYSDSNRYELFENYYRDKARKITLPCATTNGCNSANASSSNTVVALLEVNSDGTTNSVTDFNGNKTSYSYNPIGWLTKIDYADPKWADKVISYATVSMNDDGISGSGITMGSLRQTISQGNYEKRVYHDALLRPIFSRERDAANASTIRYQTLAYDHENRPTLSSFPSADASNRIGMETEYDALGRVVTQTRTSDGSISRHEYLTGNIVAVTDGENNTTTTTYLAYGEPSFDKPALIEAPDSDDIAIEYNVFDQVASIRQGNVTETRLYDAYQQLCKQVRPETGITAFGYNGQRQQIWRAQGTNGSTTSCDAGAVPASHKILLGYDNLGQLRTENFPDSAPDRTYSYDANGNLLSLLAGPVNWSYLYNSKSGLEKETLSLDGRNFVLDWEYNNLGFLSSLKYPSGAIVDFAPNAIGQATKAGSYATGVSYHPNGQIKQFTYGNGIVHNVALDTTGRIDAITDVKGSSTKNNLDPSYDYNDNVSSLIDKVDRNNDVDNLVYDGVDRLVSADGKWGTGRYNYDGLGNVLSRSLNNSTINYSYNSLNRLNNLTGAYAYAYQYDNRGNVTNNGRYSLAYNLGQQMTAAKGISYVYDGHNRRVKQTKADGNHYTIYSKDGQLLHRQAANGTLTDSVYLGKALIAEVDLGTTITPPVTPDPPPTLNLQFSRYGTGGGIDCPKGFICQSSITLPNLPADGYTLSWTTSNADSCSGNVLRTGGIFKTLTGTSNPGIDFSIGAVYEARLTCIGSGGTVSKTVIFGGTGNEY
jgi:hypothetical protein